MERENRILNGMGWGLLLLFACFTLWTLPGYGIAWDAGQWFPYGDHHLRYFKTLDPRYLDWHMEKSLDIEGYREYGPLAAILSSLSYLIFHQGLGIHPVEARHLPFVLDATLMLLFIFLFGRRYFGAAAACWGIILLGLYPRFFAHAHNNVSDLPAACFFSAAAFLLAHGLLSRSWLSLHLSAVCCGILFDLRPQNLPFLFCLVFLWLLISGHGRNGLAALFRDEKGAWKKACFLIILFGLSVYVFRPGAWLQPLAEMKRVISFFLYRPGHLGRVPVFFMGQRYLTGAPSYYPWVMLFFCSPPIFLLAFFSGIFRVASVSFRRIGDEERAARSALLFLLIWVLVAVGKHTALKMGNYDGIRHFLEGLPAMALLGGAGFVFLWRKFSAISPDGKNTRRVIAGFATALLILALLIPVIRLHPFEICYYNIFAGGLKGADRSFEKEYSAHAYRAGLDWLKRHAEPGSLLCVPLAGEAASFYVDHEHLYDFKIIRTNRMPDLYADWLHAGSGPGAGRKPDLYVMFVIREGFLAESGVMAHCLRTLKPVHTLTVDGVPVLQIYKMSLL